MWKYYKTIIQEKNSEQKDNTENRRIKNIFGESRIDIVFIKQEQGAVKRNYQRTTKSYYKLRKRQKWQFDRKVDKGKKKSSKYILKNHKEMESVQILKISQLRRHNVLLIEGLERIREIEQMKLPKK